MAESATCSWAAAVMQTMTGKCKCVINQPTDKWTSRPTKQRTNRMDYRKRSGKHTCTRANTVDTHKRAAVINEKQAQRAIGAY